MTIQRTVQRQDWQCPRCPDFKTDWPAARAKHESWHHKQDNPDPEAAKPGQLAAPQILAAPKLDALKACGYYFAVNPRPTVPHSWYCTVAQRGRILHFSLRIDWLHCPVCCQPTQYAPAGPAEPKKRAAAPPVERASPAPREPTATAPEPSVPQAATTKLLVLLAKRLHPEAKPAE